MEFAETGHWRERPDLPVSLLMVLLALRLECEKSMEFTASSHGFCFCFTRESRTKRLYQSQSPLGLGWKSDGESRTLYPSMAQFLRCPHGIHCLTADSRLSQKSWYAFSFDVSGGCNLSTDSRVRRQKRFLSALRKFQRFTRSLWQEPESQWIYGGTMSWPRELSKNTSVQQSAVLAPTRDGQVLVSADVQSVRGEAVCFLWVIQQTKVVGCCPGVQALTVRGCFVVTPVDYWQLKRPVMLLAVSPSVFSWSMLRRGSYFCCHALLSQRQI